MEGEIDVAVAPGAGDRLIFAQAARPGAGQLVAFPCELQGALKWPGVSEEAYRPSARGVGAVLDWSGRCGGDAQVGEIRFFAGVGPQRDGAMQVGALEAVNDQRRLR